VTTPIAKLNADLSPPRRPAADPVPGDLDLSTVLARSNGKAVLAEHASHRGGFVASFSVGTPEFAADLACHVKALLCECDRLRAALTMIAQVRHVSGSAQGAFRSNLRIADAALAGADMSDLATVEAVANGTWEKRSDRTADGGQPSGSDRWRLLGRAAAAPEGVR